MLFNFYSGLGLKTCFEREQRKDTPLTPLKRGSKVCYLSGVRKVGVRFPLLRGVRDVSFKYLLFNPNIRKFKQLLF